MRHAPWFTAGKTTPARHSLNVLRGFHPLGGALHASKELRCKTCRHRVRAQHARDYHKCGKAAQTRGPGTDLRLKWRACWLHQPEGDGCAEHPSQAKQVRG